ncbi:MAG: cupin domain-containing protein, partial [Spirochaetes bacterium]|nr:cupin domain-containing protein [Spirochaetota bacterium]
MKLAFCHASSLPEGTFVKYHTHDVLEIVYYTHGEGEIFLDGARSEIRPGVFHVAPAGMKHEQKNRSPLRAICIGVGQSGLEDLAGAYQDLHGIVRYHAERLIAELLAKSGAWEIVALGIVYEISGLVRRIIQQPENVAPDDVVERALQLIREREGRVSVEELSTALYL